jgi:hypothetical protein
MLLLVWLADQFTPAESEESPTEKANDPRATQQQAEINDEDTSRE